MTNRFRTVIFDFDYTLADSSQGVAECINFALAGLALAPVPPEAAHRTIGLHLDEAFVQLAGERHAGRRDEFRRLFAVRADQVMNELTVLFDSVPPIVRHLKKEGRRVGIVSTKYRYRIEEFLRRERLLDAFDVITGGEDVSRHKPDPEGLHTTMEGLQSLPGETLFVGDSVVDAEAARRAGVAFAAVLSGVTPREEFAPYPSVAVCNDLFELRGWLEKVPYLERRSE